MYLPYVVRMPSKVRVLVTQSYSTLYGPMDCSTPDFSVHGISQARIPERVAISFPRGSSRPWNWTQVSCAAGRFFTNWATREDPKNATCYSKWPSSTHTLEIMWMTKVGYKTLIVSSVLVSNFLKFSIGDRCVKNTLEGVQPCHSCSIHRSQKAGTTQMSMRQHGWTWRTSCQVR